MQVVLTMNHLYKNVGRGGSVMAASLLCVGGSNHYSVVLPGKVIGHKMNGMGKWQ